MKNRLDQAKKGDEPGDKSKFKGGAMNRFSIGCFVLLSLTLASGSALAQMGPATSAGIKSDEAAAARRVMMDALQSGATHPGCSILPHGWAELEARVTFPPEYGGYAAWINVAELLPVGKDLNAYVKTGVSQDAFVRPAVRVDASTVQMTMCAPAGFSYWVIVDSGMARVPVGKIRFTKAGVVYHHTFAAPPLHGSGTASSTKSEQSTTTSEQSTTTSANQQPTHRKTTMTGAKFPKSDHGYKPPHVDNSWSPPTIGPGE